MPLCSKFTTFYEPSAFNTLILHFQECPDHLLIEEPGYHYFKLDCTYNGKTPVIATERNLVWMKMTAVQYFDDLVTPGNGFRAMIESRGKFLISKYVE